MNRIKIKGMLNFPHFAFFGTDEFAVVVLDTLILAGIRPKLIVTVPDKPQGKYLQMTPPPVKLWAEKNKISYLQPVSLKRPDLETSLRSGLDGAELFLVSSYGKLIPPAIFNLPKYGSLNIHPSLLPKYRGSSPLQTTIIDGVETSGVTITLIDEELDHGPILKARNYNLKARLAVGQAKSFTEARDELAKLGAELFIEVAPKWVAGEIKAVPQDHAQATFTKKIKKEDGEINLSQGDTLGDKGVAFYRKFLAYQDWPGIYFFTTRNGKQVRVIITAAHLQYQIQYQGQSLPLFIIDRVKPEGKKDMSYADFQRGFKPPHST